jgi:hypothetical protein
MKNPLFKSKYHIFSGQNLTKFHPQKTKILLPMFQFCKTWEAFSSAWGFHANGKQLDLANLKMQQSLNQSRDALIQLHINLKFSNCKSGF